MVRLRAVFRPQSPLAILLVLGLSSCAEDGVGANPYEDLPVGDLNGDDGKADGSWGYATTCKEIPNLPPLADPAITVSIDGLTLHLVDRAGDYDRVFPVGVGTIDEREGSVTEGESRTMYPPLKSGSSDFSIDTTDRWSFEPCRIWWTSSETGEQLPVFAGLPFMRWSGAYGIHGPITNYRAQNGGYLERGYVSHGCIRMEAADVLEVYARVSGVDRVPVRVQREPERDDAGRAEDVDPPWVGAECEADEDCAYSAGFCKANPYSGRKFCSIRCSRYCPDRTGYPTTFCVADPDDTSQGFCTVKEESRNYDCRPYDHFAPVAQARFGDPGTTARVCMPGSRGWIGDHCFTDLDCQEENHCAGARGAEPGICTQACERYCPDAPGRPPTFCVDEPALGGSVCVRQCTPESNASECPASSACMARSRAGQPSVERDVCLPL